MPRLALGICYLAMTVMAIALNLMPVCLPVLQQGVGAEALTHEQLGRLAAMVFVGICLGVCLPGPLADRISAKWFTIGGCLLLAAGLLGLHAAHSYGAMLAGVAVMGFGGGVLDLILSPIGCALAPHDRARAMNWLHSFYSVGAVLTILTATAAFRHHVGWRTLTLWLVPAPLVVAALFLGVRLPSLTPPEGQRMGVRTMLSHRFFRLVLLAIFLGGAAEMGLAQWLPAYAELELGTPGWVGGAAFLAFSVAMALGRMGIGLIRLPVLRLMAWSCALTTGLVLITGLCPWAPVALPAAVLAGATGSCLWPSTLAVAADRYTLASATMFGLLSASGNLGGIVLPWLVGVVADHSRIAIGIAASAVTPFLMLLVLRPIARARADPSG